MVDLAAMTKRNPSRSAKTKRTAKSKAWAKTELPNMVTTQSAPLLTARVGGMYQNRTEHCTVEIADLGAFLREPQPDDTVVAFAEDSGVAVLDGDVHHWSTKPADELLTATAQALSPPPDFWYASHGRGLKGIYTGPEARQRAAIAALSLPRDFKSELATEFRHPAARSSKHGCTAGPVQANPEAQSAPASLRQVGTLRRADVAAYLAAQGMTLGQRYDHSRCPIAGHEPSDAGECVATLDAGFYCYRCAGKGLHFKPHPQNLWVTGGSGSAPSW